MRLAVLMGRPATREGAETQVGLGLVLAWVGQAAAGAAAVGLAVHGDFTRAWYADTGGYLVLSVLLFALQPPLQSVLEWACKRRERLSTSAPSQQDLEDKYTGPEADHTARLAHQHALLWACLILGPGLPAVHWVGLGAALANHFADKLAFAWLHRTPAPSSGRVGASLTKALPFAVPLHLLVGIWQLGQPAIFGGGAGADNIVGGIVGGNGGGSADTEAASSSGGVLLDVEERLSSRSTLPLVLLLALLLAVFALWQVLACFAGSARLLLGACGLEGCMDEREENERDSTGQ